MGKSWWEKIVFALYEKKLAFFIKWGIYLTPDAPVAQLDRASDYGSEG